VVSRIENMPLMARGFAKFIFRLGGTLGARKYYRNVPRPRENVEVLAKAKPKPTALPNQQLWDVTVSGVSAPFI
jgi:hypothetical protein